MVMAADIARADIAMTADRTYYRFATESTLEHGEIKGVNEFDRFAEKFLAAVMPNEGEAQLEQSVKVQVFADNRIMNVSHTEQSLRRAVGFLSQIAPEFEFLEGFLAK